MTPLSYFFLAKTLTFHSFQPLKCEYLPIVLAISDSKLRIFESDGNNTHQVWIKVYGTCVLAHVFICRKLYPDKSHRNTSRTLWLHSAPAKCRTMTSYNNSAEGASEWPDCITEDLALLNLMFDVMNFTAKPPSSAKLKERSPYVTELPESTNNKRKVYKMTSCGCFEEILKRTRALGTWYSPQRES